MSLSAFWKPQTPTIEDIRREKSSRQNLRTDHQRERSAEGVRAKCERRFINFVREAWPILEPRMQYVHSWHIDAICDHLEAVTAGDITRLLMNVPPGAMKSLLTSVFWPAWEWGPRGMSSYRYLTSSFAETAVSRDVRKMRMLVGSEWYQTLWPHVELIRAGEFSLENSLTGTRDGVPFGSLTSRRGDRLILDDPHSVEKAESPADREKAVRRFREGAINRLNDQQKSAIIVIMQRLNEGDISGEILDSGMDYVCLILPMEYERSRHCMTEIGFEDPRTRDGELLAPERFPQEVVNALKRDMGTYAYAGQYQQRPAPRGGGIFPYNSWEYWDRQLAMQYGKSENQFPDMDFILAVADTAFTEKQENDFSAVVVLGVWSDLHKMQNIMLMHFWQKRLKFNDAVEEIVKSTRKFKADRLLIENKASGISIYQEIVRITREEDFPVQLVDPKNEDKEARASAVSGFFGEEKEDGSRRQGLVYAPGRLQDNGAIWPREWADELMAQAATFPKGKHDDGVDAMVHGLRFLRARGLIRRRSEIIMEEHASLLQTTAKPKPLYPC
jgi:predicted phage terminase large subunit-like protein